MQDSLQTRRFALQISSPVAAAAAASASAKDPGFNINLGATGVRLSPWLWHLHKLLVPGELAFIHNHALCGCPFRHRRLNNIVP